MEGRPENRVDNPRGPSEREFLPREHVTSPPQFFPANIAHKDHDGIVNENPPSPMQRNAHEILRTETIEKLVVEPRSIEESDGLEGWSKDACTPLEDWAYQNRSEYPDLAIGLSPKGKPGCRNRKQVLPITSIHEARECSCPDPNRRVWSREP